MPSRCRCRHLPECKHGCGHLFRQCLLGVDVGIYLVCKHGCGHLFRWPDLSDGVEHDVGICFDEGMDGGILPVN